MKKSFYLFCDSLSIVDKLTDEQNWKLLKMMRSYHNWEIYEPNDFVVEVAFEQFKNQFDRDLETYNNVCERNALNWAKWWRPKKNPENPSGYLKTQGNPEKPKKADKDKDTDTDKKNENNILQHLEDKNRLQLKYPNIDMQRLEIQIIEMESRCEANKREVKNWKSFAGKRLDKQPYQKVVVQKSDEEIRI